MSKILLRPFLAFVAFAAGLKVVVALGSGLFGAQSSGQALMAFFGLPTLLVVFTVWLAPSTRRRRAAMLVALGTLLLSLSAGAVGLIEFVIARANNVSLEAAMLNVAVLRDAAGLGLCVAGLSWGVVCAANILGPTSQTGVDRSASEPVIS